MRKWTREERRKHIREKYYPWKTKIFVMIVCMAAIFIFLYLLISGVANSLVVGGLSAVILVLLIFIIFFISYGVRFKFFRGLDLLKLLILIVIFLMFVLGFLTAGSLSGTEQVVSYIILGFLFLILLAFAVFFIDVYTYESY